MLQELNPFRLLLHVLFFDAVMNLEVEVSRIEKTKDATEMTEKLVFIFYFRKVRLLPVLQRIKVLLESDEFRC